MYFNPRVHAGRDSTGTAAGIPHKKFQSTRPRGTRHSGWMVISKSQRFQSTRPRGTRPLAQAIQIHTQYFNPRVHAGRDAGRYKFTGLPFISIHASTRDATLDLEIRHHSLIFQSTRPRGTRQVLGFQIVMSIRFQSTRPRGTRHHKFLCIWFELVYFNPRVHAGRDVNHISLNLLSSSYFNPRVHAGRDVNHISLNLLSSSYFNPRVHAGRDMVDVMKQWGSIFQSTRPRGTRP